MTTGPGAGDELELGPGACVGPYRIAALVGRGGMGVVFEARHAQIGQRVALKLLSPGRRATATPAAVRRFMTEVQALSRLDHPGLVRVIDCGDAPEHGPWIAMEYIAGEPLRGRLDRLAAANRRMPLEGVLRTLRQIASAVAAIHKAGIIHRDLKPENLMLTTDDEVPGGERIKLLDFGIAKLLDGPGALTTEGTVLGTAGYMSPEQCTGARELDGQADVYAVGVIAFELLAGELPFTGDARAVMSQHLFADPPLARLDAALPGDLVTLVSAALAKEPSRRPAIEEVVERLRRLEARLAGGPAAGQAPDPGTEPGTGAAETLPALAARSIMPTVAERVPAVAERVPAVAERVPAVAERVPAVAERVPAVAERVPAVAGRGPASRGWIAAVAGGVAVVAGGAWLALRAPARAPYVLPGMVAIEGARFRMGSTRAEVEVACAELPGGCTAEEQPQLAREQPPREVVVSAFQLDAREVTNQDYAAFLAIVVGLVDVRDDRDDHYPRFVIERASSLVLLDMHPELGGIARTPDGRFVARPGREQLPAVQVTWDGASHYCRQLGKRLPTEAEWELAARGVEGRRFPWGSAAPRCDGVVFGRGKPRGCPDRAPVLAPVATAAQDVTPDGVHDLGGNAGEWVQDQLLLPYYGSCGACTDPVAEHAVPLAEDVRIFRGGTYRGLAWFSRATTRSRWQRTEVMDGVGFRCATR